MKNNLLKTAAACLLIFASLMSLAACTAKPAEPTDETPAQTQTPNTTSRPSDPVKTQTPETDPQPEEQPDDTETPEEQPAQQVSVQELLRLAEQQDPEFPGHTPYLVERADDEDGNVRFKVAFRSESGWLVYAAKEYDASFNDDGGHLTATRTTFSSEDAPQLSSQASDPKALLPLAQVLEDQLQYQYELNFEDASELTSDQLYLAYLVLATPEELQARYNEAEQKYFISWRHVTPVLDRYFVNYKWDMTECALYDSTFDGIVTDEIHVFDKTPHLRVVHTEPVEGTNKVRFTVEFYADETEQTVTKRKVYTVEFYDDGYHYLSVMELMVN